MKHPEIFDEKNRAVLHFEMFSGHNLIERLDPDKQVYKSWTIDDTDDDAFSQVASSKLETLPGLSQIGPALDEKTKTMEEGDPNEPSPVAPLSAVVSAFSEDLAKQIEKMNKGDRGNNDPSLWSDLLDDNTLEALSMVIAHHVSEWKADWKKVIDRWYREWGMPKDSKLGKEQKATAEHAVKVAAAFAIKWEWPIFKYRQPFLNANPYFYHPIRLLNWLNGMERTIDHPDLKYNTLETTAFDISPRKVKVTKEAAAGAAELFIDTVSARGVADSVTTVGEDRQRAIIDIELLKGSRFRLASSEKIYTISETSKEKDGRRIKFDPGLESEVKKGDTIRFGLYAWKWVRKFDWNRNFH